MVAAKATPATGTGGSSDWRAFGADRKASDTMSATKGCGLPGLTKYLETTRTRMTALGTR